MKGHVLVVSSYFSEISWELTLGIKNVTKNKQWV